MQKKDKEIFNRSEIDLIIENTDVCRIAFAKNNIPYIVPVSFGYDRKNIFVHTAKTGRKIDFINENNLVCFEFDKHIKTVTHEKIACKWTANYESVIGYGKIIEIIDDNERIYAINQIMLHYSGKEWDFDKKMLKNTKLLKINIEEITGKRSK